MGIATRLIGRDTELQQLFDALYIEIEQRGVQLVSITGEPGIGKSRLIDEFLQIVARLPDPILTFREQASPRASRLPYNLLRVVVSHSFAISESDTAAMVCDKLERGCSGLIGAEGQSCAHLIAYLIGLDMTTSPHLRSWNTNAEHLHERAIRAFLRLITEMTAIYPAVIIIDDLHWIDDGSLEVIERLLHDVPDAAALIVTTSRLEDHERCLRLNAAALSHTRIELDALSEQDSQRLVAEILRKAGRIPSAVRDLIVSRAEGNPFYIEELIQILIEDRVIVADSEHWHIYPQLLATVRVPPTLTALIESRLAMLAPDELALLERAAVIGRVFWDGALVQLHAAAAIPSTNKAALHMQTDACTTADLLERLHRKEFFIEQRATTFAGNREFSFKHAILQEVAYKRIDAETRRLYHAQMAVWLVEQSGAWSEEYAGVIAEHYERAAMPVEAVAWYERAAYQARITYTIDTAIEYYHRALNLLPETIDHIQKRIVLYEGLGEMLNWRAHFDEATALFAQMRISAEVINDFAAQVRAWRGLAWVHNRQHNPDAALECLIYAEHQARAVDAPKELIAVLIEKGWALHYLDNPDAVTAGRQALDLSTGMDDRAAMANSLSLLGAAYGMLERYDLADHCERQALMIYRELNDLRGEAAMLNNLGSTADTRGDWETAAMLYEEALLIARSINNRDKECFTLTNLAHARLRLGDINTAESNVRESLRLAETYGKMRWSFAYSILAEVHLARGENEEAMTAARQAVELGMQMKSQSDVGVAWRVIGVVMGRLSEGAGAVPCFTKSADIFAEIGAESERARTLREWAIYDMTRDNRERGYELWHEAHAIFARLHLDLELARMPTLVDG